MQSCVEEVPDSMESIVKRAITPGTFDPITFGHLDVITRAAQLMDEIVVAVAASPGKNPLFTLEERVELAKKATAHLDNVTVAPFEGLLVDFAKQQGAQVVVKGLRAITDFEYEFQMALTNRKLNNELDTVFLASDASYTYLSSSIVKNVAYHGGDISNFVPACIHDEIFNRLNTKGNK